MRVIDPGHYYVLDSLDTGAADISRNDVALYFVKRTGDGYPGNGETSYSGPICQEVIRALLDRVIYLNGQRNHFANGYVIGHLRSALRWLEARAAEERQDAGAIDLVFAHEEPESIPACASCGHVFCKRIHAP